ncbi:hypothetical protein FGIG_00815 [Fasciola gigantica]|uniref:Uncharacterized protein n=1 Tax=Fasciola gigantica TaxID=46835 RepID=A0A504YE96_FASGI|nr:hypothetical protein FGIG_00815 [Fasciola gigantica]
MICVFTTEHVQLPLVSDMAVNHPYWELLDTWATCSLILPGICSQSKDRDAGPRVSSANGSPVKAYGSSQVTCQINGEVVTPSDVLSADITWDLIQGLEFLHKNRRCLDLTWNVDLWRSDYPIKPQFTTDNPTGTTRTTSFSKGLAGPRGKSLAAGTPKDVDQVW